MIDSNSSRIILCDQGKESLIVKAGFDVTEITAYILLYTHAGVKFNRCLFLVHIGYGAGYVILTWQHKPL